MTRCLVTGGAGFIGFHVVSALIREGVTARILDNFSTGKRENVMFHGAAAETVEGDVRDPGICLKASKGADVVVHLAALHEVPRSVEHPDETHEINVTGILNVLMAAKKAGVKRFVFASSSAVYGNDPALPRKEETVSPFSSPYSASKYAGEIYCRMFSELYGLETLSLRFFNVYGPRQDASSQYAGVIPKFVSALSSDTPPVIYGDGEQTRDFIYAEDCARAVLSACTVPGISGSVINVGTGERISVNRLCELVRDVLGKRIDPRYGPPQPGDIRHDTADITKARTLLSFEPRWDIGRGLVTTARWYAGME